MLKANVLKKNNPKIGRFQGRLTQKISVCRAYKIRDVLKYTFYFSMFMLFPNIEHQY